jgi:glycerophosphoryl diester phosphodiesterase
MTSLPVGFRIIPLAHRGLYDVEHGRPENSIPAIRAAIDSGYGIEIDVQLSADNQAMVFHDYDLGRLTSHSGAVRQHRAADLGAMTLIGSSATIPTLGQVLSVVAAQTPLLLEIKDQDGAMGPDTGDLERAIADAVRRYGGPVAVMSFNTHSVALMAEIAPQLPRGLTTGALASEKWRLIPAATRDRMRLIPDYDAVGASFISHQITDLDRPRVSQLKAQGAVILCWTAKNNSAERAAREIAHNITFDGYRPEIPEA